MADSLAMGLGLGGAAAFTVGYSRNALQARFAAGEDRAFEAFAFAATYDRMRLSLAFEAPVVMKGESGSFDGVGYAPPHLALSGHPDTLSDVRLSLDARLLGDSTDPLRVGVGAAVIVQGGERNEYVTDDTYRAMTRLNGPGDVGHAFSYALFVAVHGRHLKEGALPKGPPGSELVFGAGAGPQVGMSSSLKIGLGLEACAATAYRAFF